MNTHEKIKFVADIAKHWPDLIPEYSRELDGLYAYVCAKWIKQTTSLPVYHCGTNSSRISMNGKEFTPERYPDILALNEAVKSYAVEKYGSIENAQLAAFNIWVSVDGDRILGDAEDCVTAIALAQNIVKYGDDRRYQVTVMDQLKENKSVMIGEVVFEPLKNGKHKLKCSPDLLSRISDICKKLR